MPGATVLCAHGGRAHPLGPTGRVLLGGSPLVVQAEGWIIDGCALAPAPCATARFVTAAGRIRCGGQPVILRDCVAVCAPTGTPLDIVQAQSRVTGA